MPRVILSKEEIEHLLALLYEDLSHTRDNRKTAEHYRDTARSEESAAAEQDDIDRYLKDEALLEGIITTLGAVKWPRSLST